jgi:hypothetical protein
MTTTFQISGTTLANLDSTYLQFGNPVSSTTPTGSSTFETSISLSGTETDVANSNVVTVTIPVQITTTWCFDLYIRGFSDNTSCSTSYTVLKSKVDGSGSWKNFQGLSHTTDINTLTIPTITVDSTARTITVGQDAGSVNDGIIYYVIKFQYTSGNNQDTTLPIFSQ